MYLCDYIHVQYLKSIEEFGELIRTMTGDVFEKLFMLSYELLTNDGIESYIGFSTNDIDKFTLRVMDISRSFPNVSFTVNSLYHKSCRIIQNGMVICYADYAEESDDN